MIAAGQGGGGALAGDQVPGARRGQRGKETQAGAGIRPASQ
jgi:hypothetical protein